MLYLQSDFFIEPESVQISTSGSFSNETVCNYLVHVFFTRSTDTGEALHKSYISASLLINYYYRNDHL